MAAVSDITPVLSRAILLGLARSCEKMKTDLLTVLSCLQIAAELFRRYARHTAEHLREMTRTCVTDVQPNLYETARGFADELLRTGDPLPNNKLHRRHAGGLLEHAREVKRT